MCFLCRLFTTVRDSLGLTYDVSFELNLFDRLNLGWYVISVTSTPGKVRSEYHPSFLDIGFKSLSMPFTKPGFTKNVQVHKAVDACKNVLRGLHSNKITPRELDRVSCNCRSFSIDFASLLCLCLYTV